jgi:transcriptional regulator with XRE-family HTH domain
MKSHEFTIIASGLDPEAEDFADRFFEAGCDDATLSFQKGVIILEFTREAVSISKAVASAYADVRHAGASVDRIEPDYLVSLSEIAERSGKSRQAISLYTNGERGEGFPAPVARIMSKHPLYDWEEVAGWLVERNALPKEELVRARVVKEANMHLDAAEPAEDNFVKRLEAVEAEPLEPA